MRRDSSLLPSHEDKTPHPGGPLYQGPRAHTAARRFGISALTLALRTQDYGDSGPLDRARTRGRSMRSRTLLLTSTILLAACPNEPTACR